MTRKAFIVGINDYSPTGVGGPDLRGCVNDARNMAHTLHALGIVPATPATMRILTNSRATRAAIIKGFEWLIKGAKKNDTLVFFYSGHGSQVADYDGEEIDRKDETICPHDYAKAGMIRDDDLRLLMKSLPEGANLDVIMDSCHSGTVTRELEFLASQLEMKEEMITIRYIEPPLDEGFFLDASPTLPVKGFLAPELPTNGTKAPAVVPGLNHVLWAACRDFQTAAETKIEGIYQGVFTFNFCKALRRAGVAVTRIKLDSLVTTDIKVMGYGQVPQLEGTKKSMSEKVFV